jgi:hypothetical protein
VGSVAQPLTQPAILYTVFIQSLESVESHTWVGSVAQPLTQPAIQLFFLQSLFNALNLSSFIRGWVRFSQLLTQVSYSLHGLYSKRRICRVSYVGN